MLRWHSSTSPLPSSTFLQWEHQCTAMNTRHCRADARQWYTHSWVECFGGIRSQLHCQVLRFCSTGATLYSIEKFLLVGLRISWVGCWGGVRNQQKCVPLPIDLCMFGFAVWGLLVLWTGKGGLNLRPPTPCGSEDVTACLSWSPCFLCFFGCFQWFSIAFVCHPLVFLFFGFFRWSWR